MPDKLLYYVKRDKYLLFLVLPGFLYFLVFAYMPMFGVVMAFQNFKINTGYLGSQFVGLKWFIQFAQSPFFFRLIKNTFLLSFLGLITGLPASIIFALMLNEVGNGAFKRITQSVSYFPYFISTVVVVGILVNLLNPVDGVVNNILKSFGREPINFMNDAAWFRTIYVSSGVWQSFGWNAILYIGAISAIDPTLYEAAMIDGAGRFQRIRYITLPGIVPVLVMTLILALGGILNVGFEKIILMYNPATYSVADVISSYVFRVGLVDAQYSYSSSIGLFNSVVNTVFILIANTISKRVTGIYLW